MSFIIASKIKISSNKSRKWKEVKRKWKEKKKEVKNPYPENCKILMKEAEDSTNKYE